MSIFNKAMWCAVLVSAILLILITGQTNKRNFEEVRGSIEEIYKDRLVVKGLIYNLVTDLHQKELALIKQDKSFFPTENKNLNERILKNIEIFRATKLTASEDETLRRFAMGVTNLIASENTLGLNQQEKALKKDDTEALLAMVNGLYGNLDTLSKIQLEEGKRKLLKSEGAISSMRFFERVENYFVIVFGILVFVIIFVFPGRDAKIVLNQSEGE